MPTQSNNNSLVTQIDALLPQTQCRQCNYPGCRPYAEAIASGAADINQCPPGGQVTIHALAELLGREPKPLNPQHGVESEKMVAVIDEDRCIGCVLCLKACPVDAILGASKQMHTVIADECTGCKLCIAPCPVDCIEMQPITMRPDAALERKKADIARQRFEARNTRLQREQAKGTEKMQLNKQNLTNSDADAKQAAIAAAMQRVLARKAMAGKKPPE
jgi:electron transport complex protein RnfB